MKVLKTELRLRLQNRKSRTLSRGVSADDDVVGAKVLGGDSTVSSPSTPNSSCSSTATANHQSSNTIGTPSAKTPSSATPTQQTPGTPLNTTINAGSTGSSGHKNSLKGTKLARRARSFKDDLFEKISLMRTPTNTLGRSHSPHSPRNKALSSKPPPTAEEVAKSSQSLETHVKDISNALKHFRDVILKRKLEVLPGNGTVILETIASMYAVIQSYTLNENSTVMLSATQQVYQSLGKLIKLCDEVMLSEETNDCASLNNDNVKEVVDLLEDAVRNLVCLAQQKLKEKEENAFKYGPSTSEITATSNNYLMRPPVEVAGQRTSLPDITLTPKERDILEKTKSNPIRASHSTESILRDTSPPPKPPLPNRTTHPPPLPPKRRSQQQQQQNSNNISINSDLDCSSEFSLNYGVDHLSVRSRSPDENSSQCSLDSALNHSREEEELKALVIENRLDDILDDSVQKILAMSGKMETVEKPNLSTIAHMSSVCGASGTVVAKPAPIVAAGISNVTAATTIMATTATVAGSGSGSSGIIAMDKTEMRKSTTNNRHSNESGFVSMNSFRTSTQSVSKRSSEYSFQSSSKSSIPDLNYVRNSSDATGYGAIDPTTTKTTNNHEFHQHQHQQQQQHHQTTTHFTTAASIREQQSAVGNSSCTSTTTTATKISSSSCSNSSSVGLLSSNSSIISNHHQHHHNNDNHSINYETSTSPDNIERSTEKLFINQLQSMSSLGKTNSLDVLSVEDLTNIVPPALPPKTTKCKERLLTQYDNNFDEVDDINNSFTAHDLPELRQHQHQLSAFQWQSKHQSLIEPRRAVGLAGSCNVIGIDGSLDEPPPLPMKKKHILAYMEICSSSTRSMEQHRHTVHTYNLKSNIPHSQTMNIVPVAKDLNSPENEIPPALPPKNYKQRRPSANPTPPPTIITTPPPSPKPSQLVADSYIESGGVGRHGRVLSATQGSELMTTVCEELADLSEEDQIGIHHSHKLPNEMDATTRHSKINNQIQHMNYNVGNNIDTCTPSDITNEEDEGIDIVLEKNTYNNNNKKDCSPTNSLTKDSLPNLLEEIDITPYLILKKDGEDGPEVKGGYIDALIVHASRVQKISDNAFSEAFITTFRTFIQPIDVIEKLSHRYTVFFCQLNDLKQKAAKETFSLLVRVVNDLTSTDLTGQLLTLLVEFVYQLVCSGRLYLAKLLRNKIIEKVTLYKEQKFPSYSPNMHVTVTNQPSLLDLKSVEIAEQMTLLDAELFQKIEIPEVLLFAKEQCEEKSPNLNKFTEHFNKMSYWARSKILMLSDAKEREKHVIKFIKIMKHLRKMNNYNSYLALLSALDSAPIRRLEWHKTITEGLKEYCTLIDSSSSFRVYRQALAETNPPCIPYIGLVLQDLTFVHVGNPDYLKDGVINFSKRWQQHNIIVNMKRFKKCSYPFRRNDRIIRFFENFENFLGEEEMWQISETIKPRGRRTVHN